MVGGGRQIRPLPLCNLVILSDYYLLNSGFFEQSVRTKLTFNYLRHQHISHCTITGASLTASFPTFRIYFYLSISLPIFHFHSNASMITIRSSDHSTTQITKTKILHNNGDSAENLVSNPLFLSFLFSVSFSFSYSLYSVPSYFSHAPFLSSVDHFRHDSFFSPSLSLSLSLSLSNTHTLLF